MVWFLRHVQHLDKEEVEEVERRGGGEEGRRRRGEQEEEEEGGEKRGGEGGFILYLDEMVEESTVLVQEKVSYNELLVFPDHVGRVPGNHTTIPLPPFWVRTALPSSPSHTLQLFDCSNHPT